MTTQIDDAAPFDGKLKWNMFARVLKYSPETVRRIAAHHGLGGHEDVRAEHLAGFAPDEVVEAPGNLLTTAGLNRITNLIIGSGGQAFTNSRAVIGVGTSSTAAAITDVALGNDATANAYYQGADAANPTQANGVVTCNATFASGNANFAWQEWCWGVATAAVSPGTTFATVSTTGILLNHKIQSLGTKVSGAVWTLQATVTLS